MMSSKRYMFWADLFVTLREPKVWIKLSQLDIKNRFLGTSLGPIWAALSSLILVGAMGPLYGVIFRLNVQDYILHLSVSYITWMFIATLLTESCTVFLSAKQYIENFTLSPLNYVMRYLLRNLLLFFYSFVAVIVVLLYLQHPITFNAVFSFLGIMGVVFNGGWIAIIFGVATARYRDIQQIVINITQLLFFISPVLWQKKMIGSFWWAYEFNPMSHYLDSVRVPIIDGTIPWKSIFVVYTIGLIGWLTASIVFKKTKDKIVYWI